MTQLHPQLARDTAVVGRFPLCHVLLMKDANYPWCILVPDREETTEVYQLDAADQDLLIRESSFLAQRMMACFGGDKMNIGALGNVVPQLHLHHIVRFHGDPAWPAPVWGRVPRKEYTGVELVERLQQLRAALAPRLEIGVGV